MQEDSALAEQIRTWLERVMAETGLTVTAWADKAKVARTTIARPLKPGYEFVTSSRTLAKLAEAAGVPAPGGLAKPHDARLVPNFLPTRFRVQAGHWYETDEYAQDFPAPSQPVAPDPRYAEWPQWLEEVVGDSVDLIIRPGGFAHVVDAINMGYSPRHNDLVVVERRLRGGSLRERSIKQLDVTNGQVKLWPRSSNEKWSSPLVLDGNGSDDAEIEIVGLVVGAYSSFT